VERRVAQGRPPDSPADRASQPWDPRLLALIVGLGFVVLALSLYAVRQPQDYYNHFVWQAQAFLNGRAEIDYPVLPSATSPGNDQFQDVLRVVGPGGEPTGRGLIPFPPLPAIFLVPFVAVWGLATSEHLVGALLGAIDVGLAWWMLGRLPIGLRARVLATVFFAFGTVFWYTAQLGTTWYFAHIVAVGFTFLAVGLAIGADRDSALDEDELPDDGPLDEESGEAAPFDARGAAASLLLTARSIDRRQFLAGLALGLAATARLSVIFGAPFLLLVGSGGTWLRRGWSAALGVAIPIAALLAYNVISTGHLVHPAYGYLYRLESLGYPELGYHADWEIEDPRYIPQNLGIALFSLPVLFPNAEPRALDGLPLCTEPGAQRSLLDPSCPIALPHDTGMSILFSSPAYLLAIPALRRLYGRSRLVSAAAVAVLLIAIFNLMHFSQGWVQIGYRFGNDFVPFALPIVALGIDRLRNRPGRWLADVLVAASVAVSLWGVYLQHALGW
jgi:hypothetical protein